MPWVIYRQRWLRILGSRTDALTLPELIAVKADTISPRLLRHEMEHVRQWRRCLYVFFPVVYGIGAVIGLFRGSAYWDNPLECAARRAEAE